MRFPVVLLAVFLASSPAIAQGQRIQARDGDTIVVEGTARVRIVRHADAFVRAIFNPAQHWLVLVVDLVDPARHTPDGRVDATYTFYELSGGWPFGERWEGLTVIEDYEVVGDGPSYGMGLAMKTGLVQLLIPDERRPYPQDVSFRNPSAALVLTYGGSGRGTGGTASFTEVEQRTVAAAMRSAESRARTGAPGSDSNLQFMVNGRPAPPPPPAGSQPPAPQAPVRVGGNIRTPRKIQDAAAVLPETARQAGVGGVVILEITIGTDGAVKEARVLHSIPLLDQAALDAARKWRYEVTLLNGQPVPVIMTATVAFQ